MNTYITTRVSYQTGASKSRLPLKQCLNVCLCCEFAHCDEVTLNSQMQCSGNRALGHM